MVIPKSVRRLCFISYVPSITCNGGIFRRSPTNRRSFNEHAYIKIENVYHDSWPWACVFVVISKLYYRPWNKTWFIIFYTTHINVHRLRIVLNDTEYDWIINIILTKTPKPNHAGVVKVNNTRISISTQNNILNIITLLFI